MSKIKTAEEILKSLIDWPEGVRNNPQSCSFKTAKKAMEEYAAQFQSKASTNTNPNFWDCECDENYIHPKRKKVCKVCGCLAEDMPDSIESEVEAIQSPAPSDDEINEAAYLSHNYSDEGESDLLERYFKLGAKWMRDQALSLSNGKESDAVDYESMAYKNLRAVCSNLIGVIENKQWERLGSKTWALKDALQKVNEIKDSKDGK